MQTLDHIQMAKIFVISFPRPINAWVLTSYLVKDVGAQEVGLVHLPKPTIHNFGHHVQLHAGKCQTTLLACARLPAGLQAERADPRARYCWPLGRGVRTECTSQGWGPSGACSGSMSPHILHPSSRPWLLASRPALRACVGACNPRSKTPSWPASHAAAWCEGHEPGLAADRNQGDAASRHLCGGGGT